MSNKKNVGFTFIELLVVISVMGIISISGIAAFVSYDKSQKLNTATLDVVSMLNLAKSRAQTQVKPEDCVGPGYVLDGYEVEFSLVDYELNVVCNGTLFKSNMLTGKLPTGYSDFVTTTYFFPVIKGGVDASGTITIDDGDSTKNIQIDASGNISIQ